MAGDARDVRLALIGLGNWGRRLAGCVRAAPAATLAWCFARDVQRREAFAAEVGAKAATSLDMILEDPDLDGVLIATPHSTHADLVCATASAGKHVFIEKPMTLTVSDAWRCIRAAQQAGVVLYVDHFRRRMAATRELRRLMDEGKIGHLHQIEGYFSRPAGQQAMPGWRDDPQEAPLGGMTALGVHMADNMHYLAGPVARLTAFSKRLLGRGSIDDVTGVLIEYSTGPLGYLGTSLVVPKVATTAVLGTNAAAWSEEDGTRLFLQQTDEEVRHELSLSPVDPVADSVADFVQTLRTGSPPETGPGEGLEIATMLEAISLSAAQGGAPVELDELRSER